MDEFSDIWIDQCEAARDAQNVLRRYDRKPKRLATRRLYMLLGLPGVGPALANRLLLHQRRVKNS